MSGEAPRRMMVADASVLRLAPHVKFRHDETRGRWVVLAPERLLLPDEPAVVIAKDHSARDQKTAPPNGRIYPAA